MEWLRIVSGLIAICLWMIIAIPFFNFKKELKKGLNEDRSLSDEFIKKWDKISSRTIVLIIFATIFSLAAVLLVSY